MWGEGLVTKSKQKQRQQKSPELLAPKEQETQPKPFCLQLWKTQCSPYKSLLSSFILNPSANLGRKSSTEITENPFPSTFSGMDRQELHSGWEGGTWAQESTKRLILFKVDFFGTSSTSRTDPSSVFLHRDGVSSWRFYIME